jgi:hypothetical protein
MLKTFLIHHASERRIVMEPDFSEFKTYHIHLLFRNDPQWRIYRIPFSDYGRIRDGFAGENELLNLPGDWNQFVAYGNLRVLFRTSSLQAVHFLWEPINGRPDEEPEVYENIRIFLSGQSSPIEAGSSDDDEIVNFYNELLNERQSTARFIGFPDEEGEEIYIDSTQAYMVEIPEFMLDGNDEHFNDDDLDNEDGGPMNLN